jgi:hypothetical protein
LPALGVVVFAGHLAVVEGQKPAAEAQGLDLHDGGERERVQTAESAVFVEQLRHAGMGGRG